MIYNVGCVPKSELKKITGGEDPELFQACVSICSDDSDSIDLWMIVGTLENCGLYDYADIVCKIHGELPIFQRSKDDYIKFLETALKYMK